MCNDFVTCWKLISIIVTLIRDAIRSTCIFIHRSHRLHTLHLLAQLQPVPSVGGSLPANKPISMSLSKTFRLIEVAVNPDLRSLRLHIFCSDSLQLQPTHHAARAWTPSSSTLLFGHLRFTPLPICSTHHYHQ